MSELITWDKVIKNAFEIFDNRSQYAYWYDAKGILLTEESMDYLIQTNPKHFSKYTEAELRALKSYSLGKIGFDCSGFIYAITEGRVGGSANSIYNNSERKWSNTYDNWAGTLLHKNGHIGIDIGYGWGFHFPNEGHTCELVHSRSYDWTDACTAYGVDYTGADAR